MTPFDALKAQLSAVVPFAAYVGVEITDIGEGTATTVLTQSQNTSNHIATMHAGALFTLAEAASGAAMAGMFLDRLAGLRPVAASSKIDYAKPARGVITAHAEVDGAKPALLAALDSEGKVRFPISVRMEDATGREVARMTVDWHVTALARAA
ncbi:YiiD C-terminal domain-containing protein [Erythrobacter sp. W302b]|uniref:YiiD C-terminal domain-containing protein n=1 Tax=Erythrobacter sp. W302b TaxID=3389874 RepID=UPI00396B3D56